MIVNPSAEELISWVAKHSISVLNVAGSRASSYNPEIARVTYYTVKQALKILMAKANKTEETKWV